MTTIRFALQTKKLCYTLSYIAVKNPINIVFDIKTKTSNYRFEVCFESHILNLTDC